MVVAAELELLAGIELAGAELMSIDELAEVVAEDVTGDELSGETLAAMEDAGRLELIVTLEDFELPPPPLPPQAVRPMVMTERSNTRE